jgi:ribosomal protein S19
MLVNAKILENLTQITNVTKEEAKQISLKIRSIKRSFKRFTDSRFLPIPINLTGFVLYIHKGNKYKRLRLTHLLVGFKLGEFSFTRKPFKYPIKKKKKNFVRR